MAHMNVPSFDRFMNPVMRALKQLGGSGTIEEINSTAAEIAKLTDEQLEYNWPLKLDHMLRWKNRV